MSAPHAPLVDPQAPSRLPLLDGLRALAMLLVLFAHASARGVFLVPGLDLRGCGRPGVFLFFVLSSFLLTRQFLERDPRDLRSARTWGRYLARRVLRIYPAYLAVTLVYLGAEGWTPEQFVGHLTLQRGERHFWTIPVEFLYYMALPFVVVALVAVGGLFARGRTAAQLALLTALGIAVRAWAPPDYGGRPPDYHVPLAPFVPIFLAGSAAAVVFHAWRQQPEERRARARTLWSALALACAIVLALHAPALWSLFAGEHVELTRFHLHFDRFGLLWAGVVLGLACGSPALRRPFETRAMRWMGEVSFGAYLFHRFVLTRVEEWTPDWPTTPRMLLFLAATLAAGWLSYVVIERPCSRLAAAGAR